MLIAAACRFKRLKGSDFETGIAVVNEVCSLSPLSIIDSKGQYVDKLWDANVCYQYGCFILPTDLLFERGGT
jgi:hypothetical protein